MSKQKMIDVLFDIQLTQALYLTQNNEYNKPELKNALISSVLEKHQITQAILDSSIVWYSDNIGDYIEINDSVLSRLKARQISVNAEFEQYYVQLDKKNHKGLPPFTYLNSFNSVVSFNIDSSQINKIDISNSEMSFDLLGYSNQVKITASLLYDYGDTSVVVNQRIESNGQFYLRPSIIPNKVLKNISGYVHAKFMDGYKPSVLLYNLNFGNNLAKSNDDNKIDQFSLNSITK